MKNPYWTGEEKTTTDNYFLGDAWDICNNCTSTPNNCHKKHAIKTMENSINAAKHILFYVENKTKQESIDELKRVIETLTTKKAKIK